MTNVYNPGDTVKIIGGHRMLHLLGCGAEVVHRVPGIDTYRVRPYGATWDVPVKGADLEPLDKTEAEALRDARSVVAIDESLHTPFDPQLLNVNSAGYPRELADVVANLVYREGWSFHLGNLDRGQGSTGLTLTITVRTVNSYHPAIPIMVRHLFIVPAAAYSYRSWRRWLFEQVLLVERHEAMEFFTVAGEKPYAPHHGPGEDPYTVYEHGSDVDVKTSFRGELNE